MTGVSIVETSAFEGPMGGQMNGQMSGQPGDSIDDQTQNSAIEA